MGSQMQAQVFTSAVRIYDSVLGKALFDDNMPEAVYRTLVSEVNGGSADPAPLF
ncbi:MAG: hypothetical protein ACJ04O_12765 [Cellvibrionales bacterium]|tara:strand:- start:1105 stop:1266 length:162 start_codon:yes stop_codon:yes gene_type:complete